MGTTIISSSRTKTSVLLNGKKKRKKKKNGAWLAGSMKNAKRICGKKVSLGPPHTNTNKHRQVVCPSSKNTCQFTYVATRTDN